MQKNLQNKPSATFQAVSYQGVLPPPDMMENFKKVGNDFPERIVKMAEKSLEKSFKELEVLSKDIDRKQHEAETKRLTVNEDAKYNFRAQMIILVMVLSVLGSAILLGVLGLSSIAYVVVGGGFATIIIAAIKGVSSKDKVRS